MVTSSQDIDETERNLQAERDKAKDAVVLSMFRNSSVQNSIIRAVLTTDGARVRGI